MGSLETLASLRLARLLSLAACSIAFSITVACSTESPTPSPSAESTGDMEERPASTPPAAAADSSPADDVGGTAPDDEGTVVAATDADDELVYDIECDAQGNCLVDKATYVGWRTYHAACHVCHAQDAVGSTFAPSLVTRLQEIDKARFYESVTNGYTGQLGVMPAWGADPNVNTKFDELYAYLKARSDGILAAGRPTRKR